MRHQAQERVRRIRGVAFGFKRVAAIAGCLLFIIFSTGCGALRVQQMQRHAARGDDAWIVAQPVDCDAPSRTCGRLHLIKGSACLNLAKTGRSSAAHYACAADELARGIALTPDWEDMDEALGMHERSCEALDGLLGLQSEPTTADETRKRLLDAAQALYQLAPESVPSIYFISIAWLRQLAPRIPAIQPADRLPVCNRLKRTVNQVLSLMESAKQENPPDWDRFAGRYQRLSFDLGAAIRSAGCR